MAVAKQPAKILGGKQQKPSGKISSKSILGKGSRMEQPAMKWVNPDTGEVMVISYSQQLQRERLRLERAKLREAIRRRRLQTIGLIIIVITLIFLIYIFYRLDQLNAVMNFLLK